METNNTQAIVQNSITELGQGKKQKAGKDAKRSSASKINRDIVRNFMIKIVLALVLGFLGFLAVPSLFPIFSRAVFGTVDWGYLGDFSGTISLALLFGGFAFAIFEYVGKERAKHDEKLKLSHEIYQAIYEKLTDPAQEAARRWILANIEAKKDEEDLVAWYEKTNKIIMSDEKGEGIPEGQKSIKLTLNCFDYIGFIAEHYWEPDEDSIDWISAPIAKVWTKIGPYAEQVGTLRGVKDYYLSAQYIGNLCVEWRKKKGWDKENFPVNTP